MNIKKDYEYAKDLIKHINEFGDFSIGGAACYPEGHIECDSLNKDIENLKQKVYCGVDFFNYSIVFLITRNFITIEIN